MALRQQGQGGEPTAGPDERGGEASREPIGALTVTVMLSLQTMMIHDCHQNHKTYGKWRKQKQRCSTLVDIT